MACIWLTSLVSLALFAGMLLLLDVGRRIGARRRVADPDGAQAGNGAVDGAVFALLGLLVAFTFSGAATRFDERRSLIVQETNDIGTAYLRVTLLPDRAQPAMRDLFRRYLDSRIEGYQVLRSSGMPERDGDLRPLHQVTGRDLEPGGGRGANRGRVPGGHDAALPALNQMFDIATTRMLATRMHPPLVIYAMLFGLALVGALLAGYGMAGSKGRNWIHMVGFAVVMAGAVNVIIDLEYPRLGLIRVDTFDQALVDLRAGMN